MLREPVHPVLREGGRDLSLNHPPDEPAPHQRSALLGAAAHHLCSQSAQRHPAQVRSPRRSDSSAQVLRLTASNLQTSAQTAAAAGERRRQHENRCRGDDRPFVRARQRHGLCELECRRFHFSWLALNASSSSSASVPPGLPV